jgi:hypothetical protein
MVVRVNGSRTDHASLNLATPILSCCEGNLDRKLGFYGPMPRKNMKARVNDFSIVIETGSLMRASYA